LGKVENPQGIVIIDEIDLHLHPSLEQEVLQRLQNTFPSLQFIVSTHSGSVITNLNQDNGKNVIISMSAGEEKPYRLPDIYGADPNIVGSDFMGTPYSNHGISEIKESILRLHRRGKIDSAQKKFEELKKIVKDYPNRDEFVKSIEESFI
jgi:AAA15 family ATPase/GTPase